ncbi:MAG: M20 metallopeptidase family protein [Chloroflexota bacterium]
MKNETVLEAALLEDAKRMLAETVWLRRQLHRRPETGLNLPQTQAAVRAALNGLGLEIFLGKQLSSVVAVLNGAQPGKTVLLRADMDALPLREATGLDYSSEIDGAMHACGHDFHTAMLVGAALLLAARRDRLAGRVIFAFQPGEEGYAGARLMIEEGLLERHGKPAAAFALHVAPTQPCGEISTRTGSVMAGAGNFSIVVHGRGGHPALPHQAIDPIPIAAEIVMALQTYVTRRTKVFEPAVLTVSSLRAGSAEVSAIPSTATLNGTIRAVAEETRLQLFDAVRDLAANIAAAHGASVAVEIEPGYPPVRNDGEVVGVVGEVTKRLLGPERFHLLPAPIMPSEDFAYILERVPGAMVFLGSRPVGPEPVAHVHSPQLLLNEDALAVGVALHCAWAMCFASRSI